jgi:hypothetical protein
MVVEFPGPGVATLDFYSYRALVDGETVACQFTDSVLQDVNPGFRHADMERRFMESREVLLRVAERKIRARQFSGGILKVSTSDF